MLGYTLIVSSQMGRIYEVGPDGKERWTIRGLAYPRDARVIAVRDGNGQVGCVAVLHQVIDRAFDE